MRLLNHFRRPLLAAFCFAAGAMLGIPSFAQQAQLQKLKAQADDVVVGINFTHPLSLSVEDQDVSLANLKAAGVRVIRVGFYSPELDNGIDFIKRAYAQNIRVVLTVHSLAMPNAPKRASSPEFPGMYSGTPLSSIDLALSGQFFQQLMNKLDANGIVLAGMELENEINHPAFNAEFPLPGRAHKNLGLEDFYHDPEGQQIAKGFLQYLKALALLKQIRDQSKANQHTPLISAGLSPTGPAGPWSKQVDAASPEATIGFLRANGLDQLVDGYGMHIYPSRDHPGDSDAAARRSQQVQEGIGLCSAAKPCWVTEWGFMDADKSCPPNDQATASLVNETKNDFRPFVQERRLAALMYYTWTGGEGHDVYRCGQLTETGRRALAPM